MGRKKIQKDIDGKVIKLSEKERSGLPHSGRRRWKAPLDMPDVLVKKVLSGKACGAKKPDGTYCTSKTVLRNANRPPPYRCRAHGGVVEIAPPKGKQVNLKHGVYTDCLYDWELDLFDQLKVDNLDEEIKVTKIRLRRAILADSERDPSHLCTVEETLKRAGNGELVVVGSRRSVDDGYSIQINKLVNQLVRLQHQRTQMKEVNDLLENGGRSKVVIYMPDNGRVK